MSSVAPPHQNCEALQPTRYDTIRIQLSTLGDNCNDMLSTTSVRTESFTIRQIQLFLKYAVERNWRL